MTREEQARQYANRIRNQGKRLYAGAYLGYLLGKRNEPDKKDYGISTMAAQAVRMELSDIIKPSISQPVKGEQAGMLGVPGKVHVQKRPYELGQEEVADYSKYKRQMLIEYDKKYSLKQLKEMCRSKGFSTSGDKKTLIERLI